MSNPQTNPSAINGLDVFTTHHPVLHQHQAIWAEGTIRLSITTHLVNADVPPVSDLTTSGRCIVLAPNHVLVMRNQHERHIMPGGRIEPGETSRSAAIRELGEEAGLSPGELTPLAVMVYRHLTPPPPNYRHPYPVFTNDIFVTRLPEVLPISTSDDYELDGQFVPFNQAPEQLSAHQVVLLKAAIAHSAPTCSD